MASLSIYSFGASRKDDSDSDSDTYSDSSSTSAVCSSDSSSGSSPTECNPDEAPMPKVKGVSVPHIRVELGKVGSIKYDISLGRFQAICNRHGNCGCNMIRVGRGEVGRDLKRGPKTKARGRPLGLLVAWLLGHGEDYAGLSIAQKLLHLQTYTKKLRKRARKKLKKLKRARILFANERDKDDDEGSEPDDIAT